VKQRMPQALAASTACGLKRRPTIMPRACSATAFGRRSQLSRVSTTCRADGVLVVLAFDEVARFVEALLQRGDEVDTVAVERLFGLDAVAEQAQQVGDAFLEALALRRAQPRIAGVVEVAALLDGERLGGVVLLDLAFDGEQFAAQFAVLADDRRVGFAIARIASLRRRSLRSGISIRLPAARSNSFSHTCFRRTWMSGASAGIGEATSRICSGGRPPAAAAGLRPASSALPDGLQPAGFCAP
jgi:hypothetical protein